MRALKREHTRDPEFSRLQYSTLISVWTHHNSTRLQWPAIIIGAAFVVIANGNFSDVIYIQDWGLKPELIIKAGIPLLLAGLGTFIMLYIMQRASKHMQAVEDVIDQIEAQEGVVIGQRFKQINHQKGFSGPKLITLFMVFCLAIPMTFFGCVICFGIFKGATIWVVGVVSYQVFIGLYMKLAYRNIDQRLAVEAKLSP